MECWVFAPARHGTAAASDGDSAVWFDGLCAILVIGSDRRWKAGLPIRSSLLKFCNLEHMQLA